MNLNADHMADDAHKEACRKIEQMLPRLGVTVRCLAGKPSGVAPRAMIDLDLDEDNGVVGIRADDLPDGYEITATDVLGSGTLTVEVTRTDA